MILQRELAKIITSITQKSIIYRTNLPIETMGFHDFPIPSRGRSYVPSDEVLEYLVSYAKHFNVIKHTKFEHHVIRVAPTNLNKRKWEVIVRDLRNDVYITEYFDYAMVCNGHYNAINMPDIPGINLFEGRQLHSHSYRRPESFEGMRCLYLYFQGKLKILIYFQKGKKY